MPDALSKENIIAVAIPVIAAFASAGAAVAAAGGIAAALGTVSGFLAIGGAALTAVGAVTKNSKLTKIGGFMGLAGGVGTALGLGAASTAGAGATGMDFGAAVESGTAAGNAGASSLQTATQAAGSNLAANGSEAAGLAAQSEAASQSANQLALTQQGAGLQGVSEPKLFETALNLQNPGMVGPSTYDFSANPLQTQATNAGLTSSDVVAGLKTGASKAGSAISGVGQFLKDNKELVSMGGTALASMYGPEAEKADLLKSQDAFNRSIYNRRMANLNSPVALYNKGA